MTNEGRPQDGEIRSLVREQYGKYASEFDAGKQASCCPTESSATTAEEQSSSACCSSDETISIDQMSLLYNEIDTSELPEEVTGLSLGCGDPVTLASLEPGQTVLDLGSGGGIDCFLAAKKVGETGRVIGVDMTAKMIEQARKNKAKIGAQNVEFRLGEIEHLPVADDTVDVIISNCVINLSPDKPQAFRDAFRVMKPGGKLAVSDIVTDGPLPESIQDNMNAWAGCLAGAMDVKDYIQAIEAAGFVDVESVPVYFQQDQVEAIIRTATPAKTNGKQQAKMVLLEGERSRAIDVILPEDTADFDMSKSIFSAKITAYKPG